MKSSEEVPQIDQSLMKECEIKLNKFKFKLSLALHTYPNTLWPKVNA